MAGVSRASGTWRGALRAEDLVLVGWNLVALPIGAAVAGGSWTSSDPAPLVGLLEVLAIVGAIVALATRTPGAPPLSTEGFAMWARAGPLIGAVALVGDNAADRLGLDLGVLGIVAFVATLASFVLADRLPVLDEPWRRLLVLPFVLVSAAFFDDIVASLFDDLDFGALVSAWLGGGAATEQPEVAAIAGIVLFGLVAGAAVFYAMLVLAPRELAAPESLPQVWLLRFLVFLVSAIAGTGAWLLL